MIERIVIIDSADPVSFYGVNNSNMQLLRNLFPKLRIQRLCHQSHRRRKRNG